ncbi:hypothetical protein [Candidatus Nanohalovita haloferacivicina]|uniref:hypothetical protein n=1 Tax=Candidatus Nanohalovita haloferacivicina TaxID=2978046 RepID=UPI00325FD64F|nr:hypothetical protein HBNXNv_1048 [Candidatus Nanohalobia archaeon BNXNv]
MKKTFIAVTGLLLILSGLAAFYTANATSYEKFSADFENGTETVYAECTCYGPLSVAESYPPQYSCEGIEMCTEANYTREK